MATYFCGSGLTVLLVLIRYMTLLNTCANLGSMWVTPAVLVCIDWVTSTACYASRTSSVVMNYSCGVGEPSTPGEKAEPACLAAGGVCLDKVDGYELMVVVCVALGWLWLRFMRGTVLRLEATKLSEWHVRKPRRDAQAV